MNALHVETHEKNFSPQATNLIVFCPFLSNRTPRTILAGKVTMGAARERRNLQDQITVTTAVTDNKRRGQQTSKVSFNARSSSSSSSSSSWLLYASVAVILGGYAIYPSKSNPLHSAIFLSYPLPSTKSASGPPTQYGKGPKDCIFVAFYTLVLFAVRDFIQERLGRPLAKSWGIVDAAKQEKFVQQLYQAIYFGAISIFGLFVMKRTALWYFHMPGLFDGFPHKTHDAPFKVFYLVQSANWVQQAAATMLGLEKARKDYVVLVAHHIVTLAIIPLVYITHMTHFALALVIPQDITDSFLCVSQICRRFPWFQIKRRIKS